MDNENVFFENPEEVKKSKRTVIKDFDEEQKEKEIIIAKNTEGGLRIDYTTAGRFSIPETLYWKDYSIEDVNNLGLSDQDDFLENLVAMLNNLKDDPNCKVEDMVYEEFIETLIYMKIRYNTSLHSHSWLCDCQTGSPENDKQFSTTEINLKKLHFTRIEEADVNLQKYHKEIYKDMSDKDFNDYLDLRYKNKPLKDVPLKNVGLWTREKEAEVVKIKEPIDLFMDDHTYTFRFSRIGDLIEAQKRANKKYSGQIKKVQNEKYTNVPLAEIKVRKEEKINKIKKELAKTTILYARALSLIEKDGKALSIDEKIDTWRKLSREGMFTLNDYFDRITFGLNEEKELTCNLCGNVSRRSLQQELNIPELLLLQSGSKRIDKQHPRLNIFVRV